VTGFVVDHLRHTRPIGAAIAAQQRRRSLQ